MATQTTKQIKQTILKANTPVTWKDRNHNTRKGSVVTFVPPEVSFMGKLPKKLQTLPAKNRKIEETASFARYIVAEELEGETRLFSLRPSAIAV